MQKTMFRTIKDKSNPYVMLNKTFLNDANLTAKAKGILSYLLSLPDDWKIYEDEVITHFADGRDSIRNGIKELVLNGYIEKERMRNEYGQLKGCNYSVYEIPTKTAKSNVGESNKGKTNTTNNYLSNNDSTKYNNDNGCFSNENTTTCIDLQISKLIGVYMNDLYKQKIGKVHPRLKKEQYMKVHNSIQSFINEWGVDYDAISDMMVQFLNSNINTDYNINHFATDGMMLNRMYEVAY